jgi:hypothetical protein
MFMLTHANVQGGAVMYRENLQAELFFSERYWDSWMSSHGVPVSEVHHLSSESDSVYALGL